jgi:hypothetical protein
VLSDGDGNPRVIVDSSGNVLVGTTDLNNNNSDGVRVLSNGTISMRSTQATANSGQSLILDRRSTDGPFINFKTAPSTTVGSIGTRGGDTVIASTSQGVRFYDANNVLLPTDGVGAGLDATISLGQSDGRWKDLYLSGGVYLGGTVAANKLDDYEEGTFVPVLADATTGGNTSPTVFTGKYTKIGNLVHVTLSLFNIDTTGMTSGNVMYVRGLPFTATGLVNSQGSCTLDRINFTGFVSAQVSTAGAYLFLNDMVDSALEVILTVASVVVSGGSDMSISVTYMTDA